MLLTYKDAGVDIERAERFVESIKAMARRVHRPWVLQGIGGFSAAIKIPEGYRRPLLVASTDGVGTKLKVAQALGRFDTVGIDLVAMCVNDLLPSGARPLFFLDYIASGKLEPQRDKALIEGIIRGCEEADCPLVGGETAEMPGLYPEGEFDLVGFAVGILEENGLIDGSGIKEGDVLIGLASSGVHSNGFSLIRKLIERHGLRLEAHVAALDRTLGEELLRPTRIYVKAVLGILERFPVKGMAHITGGGLPGNLPRILPEGLSASIKVRWEIPPIFDFIRSLGVPEEEMWRVFNMGIGFVLICDPQKADSIMEAARSLGEEPHLIGEIVQGRGVRIER